MESAVDGGSIPLSDPSQGVKRNGRVQCCRWHLLLSQGSTYSGGSQVSDFSPGGLLVSLFFLIHISFAMESLYLFRLAAMKEGKTPEGIPVAQDMAGRAFLELLIYLREVFWQDAMALRQSQPELYIFKHDVFETSDFHQFNTTYSTVVNRNEDPVERRLELAMPLLYEKLETSTSAILSQINGLTTSTTQKFNAMSRHNDQFFSSLLNLMSQLISKHGSGIDTHTSSTASSHQSPDPSASTVSHSSNFLPSPCEHVSGPNTSSSVPHSSPAFQMQRSVISCQELWREWTEGICGQPSVRSMDENGSEWRKEEKDRKFYASRLTIVREIERLAETHQISQTSASLVLDFLRSQMPNSSLAALSKAIRKKAIPILDTDAMNNALLQCCENRLTFNN